MKSVLATTLKSLFESTKNPETERLHPEELSYTQISKALSGASISEQDILLELRELVKAELAVGIGLPLLEGGPANAEQTLRYEGAQALLKLYRELMGALKDLSEEKTRLEDDQKVEPEIEHGEDTEGP